VCTENISLFGSLLQHIINYIAKLYNDTLYKAYDIIQPSDRYIIPDIKALNILLFSQFKCSVLLILIVHYQFFRDLSDSLDLLFINH